MMQPDTACVTMDRLIWYKIRDGRNIRCVELNKHVMNTLLQLGWGFWMGLWWISGIIIFLFVVYLILRAGPSMKNAQEYRKKLKQRFKKREIDKAKYKRLSKTIAEKEKLYQN